MQPSKVSTDEVRGLAMSHAWCGWRSWSLFTRPQHPHSVSKLCRYYLRYAWHLNTFHHYSYWCAGFSHWHLLAGYSFLIGLPAFTFLFTQLPHWSLSLNQIISYPYLWLYNNFLWQLEWASRLFAVAIQAVHDLPRLPKAFWPDCLHSILSCAMVLSFSGLLHFALPELGLLFRMPVYLLLLTEPLAPVSFPQQVFLRIPS